MHKVSAGSKNVDFGDLRRDAVRRGFRDGHGVGLGVGSFGGVV